MDPGFRERQGYYSSERDPHHQSQQQHPLQQQQQQHLPHYVHQLPHHLGLLQSHLQQHHSQSAYLDQTEHLRGVHSGPINVPLQQLIPGSGQATSSTHHPNVVQYAAEHSQPLQQPSDHTGQAGYVSPSSDQPPTMMDTSVTRQAFVSPDSPTPQEGSPEAALGNDQQNQIEITNLDPEVQAQVLNNETDAPKQHAMGLALGELQHNIAQTSILKEQFPIPDIWKPDLPSGVSLKFSQDGTKIVGMRSDRMIRKGAEFGPYNGKLVDENTGSVKDSAWEICLRGACLYLEGQNKTHNNWMAYIESANFPEEQNLEAFQSYGDIYFRTTKVIDPGSELRVFYSEEYARRVGFKIKLNELHAVYDADSKSFNCAACERAYASAKSLLRHMKIYHKPDRANEMLPILTWKTRNAIENEENQAVKRSPSPLPRLKLRVKLKKIKPAKCSFPPVNLKKSGVRSDRRDFGDQRYICTTCGKTFPTQGRLATHETFHKVSNEHTCNICNRSFSNANNYAKHMVIHKGKAHVCDVCGNAYGTRNHLTRHRRQSHTFNYSCRVCDVQFIKKQECEGHEKTHHDLKNLKATQGRSSKKVRRSQTDYNPVENVYIDDDEFVVYPGNDEDVVIQEEETVENSSLPKDMLGRQQHYYDKPRPFKCRFCPERYLSRKRQLDHESEKHTKKCLFKCEKCSNVFASEHRYMEHMKGHVKIRPFQCQQCPAAFASESALNSHFGEHTGLKPVKCEECGRGFRNRKYMNAHKRRTHKVQTMRFACVFCNKPFSNKDDLKKHERRHKGIRPFVCLECGRAFTSNYCLTAHSYTHTKEKKFGCPQCERKFTLNHQLTTHIFKVHTAIPGQQENKATQNEQIPVPDS